VQFGIPPVGSRAWCDKRRQACRLPREVAKVIETDRRRDERILSSRFRISLRNTSGSTAPSRSPLSLSPLFRFCPILTFTRRRNWAPNGKAHGPSGIRLHLLRWAILALVRIAATLVFERRLPVANLDLAQSSPAALVVFSPQRWCRSSTASPTLRNGLT